MLSTKAKIGMLLAGHVLASLILTWAASGSKWPSPVQVAHAALLFADAGLLGIWGALGVTSLWWRWPTVILGTAYLVSTVVVGETDRVEIHIDEVAEIVLMIGLPTLVVLIVLSVLHHSRQQLRVALSLNANVSSEGLQFTIRHLFVATAVVAVGLAVGRSMPQIDQTVATIVVLCPCLVLVELAVLWAALGFGRPVPRLLVVLPTAFVVGLIPPFYVKSLSQQGWRTFVAWSFITGLQATITAGSLLVMRLCGYRLVGRDAGQPNPSSAQVVSP